MRGVLPIILWLLAASCCLAQEQEIKLSNILERNMADIKSGKASPLTNKAFQSSTTMDLKKSGDEKMSYRDRKKGFGSDPFTTRSFFGLKNPWFGKKVFKSDAAGPWSKTSVTDANEKYKVETAKTDAFAQSKKKVNTSSQVVESKPFLGKGAVQGALDAENPKKKDLSIDDVREILNKNH